MVLEVLELEVEVLPLQALGLGELVLELWVLEVQLALVLGLEVLDKLGVSGILEGVLG